MTPNRRDFLTGRALLGQLQAAGDQFADALQKCAAGVWPSGPVVRLSQEAMACHFEVVLNPGPVQRLEIASEALELIARLEDQYSVYRSHTELSEINRTAAERPVVVEQKLFNLLHFCQQLSAETEGAFDPTSGPLIALWRICRGDRRIPTDQELASALQQVGISRVAFDADQRSVWFPAPGMELNLGAIGKGAALDQAAEVLISNGVSDFLLQGGRSSVLARGKHAEHPGWPVGIADPQFPQQQLATVLLCDAALSTSGANQQYFRVGNRRYGHILDPRTGWPAEEMLSVSVIAPNAALAEALSTAFFVLGVENARRYCHNLPLIGACFVTAQGPGQRSRIEVCGIAPDRIAVAAP